jgi:IS66 C-terminal element/Transposase IS66 family
MRTERA